MEKIDIKTGFQANNCSLPSVYSILRILISLVLSLAVCFLTKKSSGNSDSAHWNGLEVVQLPKQCHQEPVPENLFFGMSVVLNTCVVLFTGALRPSFSEDTNFGFCLILELSEKH